MTLPAAVAAVPLAQLRAIVYRAPIETPVITSFGTMRDRPMVLVRAEDAAGAVGWGEIWCNFPSFGAEHRARVVDHVLAPLLIGTAFATPGDAFALLTERTAVLALQSAEPGPIAQAIAGVDLALWDLAARRAGQPLWRLLGGSDPAVAVYASGLNPDTPARLAAARRRDGYRSFKLKVGFGADRDTANLRALRAELGDDATLMVDANQGWTLDQALQQASGLVPFGIDWLEEPLRADTPWPQWRQLASQVGIPLATGENVAGDAAFEAALASRALGVVQPDLGKWGGLSRGVPLAQRILRAGARVCPHWLGGGVGLRAAAHLLAGLGSGDLLEVDANPNPLRTLTWGALGHVVEGYARLTEEPGLGAAPDELILKDFLVAH